MPPLTVQRTCATRTGRRVADLGDFGFIEFTLDETAGLVRVYYLVWTG